MCRKYNKIPNCNWEDFEDEDENNDDDDVAEKMMIMLLLMMMLHVYCMHAKAI